MSSSDPSSTPIAPLLLLAGATLLVVGLALWSVAAALVIAGLMVMLAAVGLAAVQEARPPVPVLPPEPSSKAPNG